MYEQGFFSEKTKRFLIWGLVFVFCLVSVFVLVKIFVLKPLPPPPPEIPLSPEKVVIKYFSLEQQTNREEAKKYLFSDLSKVKIFGQNYQDLRTVFWGTWQDPLPKHQIEETQILGNEAKVTLGVVTNRIEAMTKEGDFPIFFELDPPGKIIFEANLIKEGDYWKIVKIDLPELILERKLGDKVEVIKDVFIRPIKIEKYLAKGVKPAEGFEFLSLEVEYENKRAESLGFYFYIFGDWRIIDENQKSHKPIFDPLEPIEVPSPVPEMGPEETKKISVFFETPEDILLKELIFQNFDKKVIFKID